MWVGLNEPKLMRAKKDWLSKMESQLIEIDQLKLKNLLESK